MAQAGWPKAIQPDPPYGSIYPYTAQAVSGEEASESHPDSVHAGDGARVFTQDECVVWETRRMVEALLQSEDTLCPKCRVSLERVKNLFDGIVDGRASSSAPSEIVSLSESIKTNGCCGKSLTIMDMVISSIHNFRYEYEAHIRNHHCPARVCPKLLPAPCHLACPAGIDIPTYLALVAQARFEDALEVIRRDNPFAWVCGLICPHPCESACVRAHLDQPINIRYLKAFVAKRTAERTGYPMPAVGRSKRRKVAVVGSGPAGLAAAHYLALTGYGVTIFESLPVAGGLLSVGIPEYRLPREIVRREIEAIQSMGVEIRTGVTVGKDVSLDELRSQGFDAFFLGIGAHQGYSLGIEGEADFPQVFDAITFLRRVSLGDRTKPAETVVIVGGGNSAMDAARTCVRLGCREVHVAYRRTRDEMPANPEEVAEAMEEGVQFHFLAVPVRIGGQNERVDFLECLQAELGKPDASGRRRPVPIPDSHYWIKVGAVIAAIGQQPDLRPFSGRIPFDISKRNLVVTRPMETRTSLNDVFAGGDAVTGPATVVEAIAAGKRAAAEIDRFLSGKDNDAGEPLVSKHSRESFSVLAAAEKTASHRIPVPLRDPEMRRADFQAVELDYTVEEAQKEARRCLRCDVCIRCGECERTCRDGMLVHALDFKEISDSERILGDYPRAAERCIGCGACALACPTGAMELVEGDGKRELRLCGTVLNTLEVATCKQCGAPFVSDRYLQYVTGRSDTVMKKFVLRRLCPKCARERRAEAFAEKMLV